MSALNSFKNQERLIAKLGEGNAYLVWIMAIYLDKPDIFGLASESLTDGSDDKKIDFIHLDKDIKRLVFAQGYYTSSIKKGKAPANKAADLNTASAWLFSGALDNVPENLKGIITECRERIENDDIDQIDLLYVHNLPESVNVAQELMTVSSHLKKTLPVSKNISVIHRELGEENADRLYASKGSPFLVREEITCPSVPIFNESGKDNVWRSAVMSVPGTWLREQFHKYKEDLFSANYRGFLGITKRKKINSGIKATAENSPSDFWAFNNGITILTDKFEKKNGGTVLSGMSIINGAQTTGSLGEIDSSDYPLSELKVLCRLIQCSDPKIVGDIIKYNNTQNEITTWDQYSNSPEQKRILGEFEELGHRYSLKRGYDASSSELGIEVVAQPLIALEGLYEDANRGKNSIFERRHLYRQAFEQKKAGHILFAFTLARAIDERRIELKRKVTMPKREEKQLSLFRNLRFKNFFIAIVGRCIETILEESTDIGEVTFTSEAANAKNKTINDLVVIWLPIVSMVLSFVDPMIGVLKRDLSEIINDNDGLDDMASSVNAHIASNLITHGISDSISTFRKIVSARS
uniref:AIPR protein n=1 Tax=Candidatus Kentrum sp. TUN TaxID=2126343 RepID=A0A451A0N1_9GAMM|nr:MAG: AIPR protein [Candidatus Kentron sp. TUN]